MLRSEARQKAMFLGQCAYMSMGVCAGSRVLASRHRSRAVREHAAAAVVSDGSGPWWVCQIKVMGGQ